MIWDGYGLGRYRNGVGQPIKVGCRKSFLDLPPMTKLNLKVSYNDDSYEVNYYVLNNYVEKPLSIENSSSNLFIYNN